MDLVNAQLNLSNATRLLESDEYKMICLKCTEGNFLIRFIRRQTKLLIERTIRIHMITCFLCLNIDLYQNSEVYIPYLRKKVKLESQFAIDYAQTRIIDARLQEV
jgi:hypothetical protein